MQQLRIIKTYTKDNQDQTNVLETFIIIKKNTISTILMDFLSEPAI